MVNQLGLPPMPFAYPMVNLLSLPPEVWRLVLHNVGIYHEDLVFLWTTCRYDSQHFRHEVEEFVASNILIKISLYLDVTIASEIKETTRSRFEKKSALMVFDRISQDRARAFFRVWNTTSIYIQPILCQLASAQLTRPAMEIRSEWATLYYRISSSIAPESLSSTERPG